MWARFSALVHTGPGAHPASCTMGTGSFPGVKSDRGVTLTPHPLLVPWLRKGRTIPLLPLCVVRPVQSLSACTRGALYFFLLLITDRRFDQPLLASAIYTSSRRTTYEIKYMSTVSASTHTSTHLPTYQQPKFIPIKITINIFNRNQHTICGQFYWVATSFDPRNKTVRKVCVGCDCKY